MRDQPKTPRRIHCVCVSVMLSSSFSETSEPSVHRMNDALMKWVHAVGMEWALNILFFTPLQRVGLGSKHPNVPFTPSLLHHTKDAVFTATNSQRVIIWMKPHDHMTIIWLQPPSCSSYCYSAANQITTTHFSYEYDYLKHFMVQHSSLGFTLLSDPRSVCSVVEALDSATCNLNR